MTRGDGKEAEVLHELGILMSVIKTVENYAAENQVGKIEKLVLQIGESSSVIPEYMRKVYPAAVEDTLLADARLEIDLARARAEGVAVVRRPSGGGTIYTDRGGWQFSVIDRAPDAGIRFDKYIAPVVEALRAMGVPAAFAKSCAPRGFARCAIAWLTSASSWRRT